jgi:glutaredoxin
MLTRLPAHLPMHPPLMHRPPRFAWLPAALAGLAGLACALVGSSAWAQYKVVQPDGSVTYTDRPIPAPQARITQLGRTGTTATAAASVAAANNASGDAGLPADLRALAQRQPVTLYTATDCAPCDAARRYLVQRGVPYSERRIINDDDLLALDRVAGTRAVPALTIGAQPLRGFAEADWASYLEAAGYPAQSRLPKGWKAPEPTPLADRPAPVVASPAPAARPGLAVATPALPRPGSIRF